MKIDQNVTLLNKVAGTSTLGSAKGSVSEAEARAAAAPARPSLAIPPQPFSSGDFDAERVAGIRESISAGRYQVNTEKIADGLLATVRELLGRKTP